MTVSWRNFYSSDTCSFYLLVFTSRLFQLFCCCRRSNLFWLVLPCFAFKCDVTVKGALRQKLYFLTYLWRSKKTPVKCRERCIRYFWTFITKDESELHTTRYSSRYVAHDNVKMQKHHENFNKNVHYIRKYPKKAVKYSLYCGSELREILTTFNVSASFTWTQISILNISWASWKNCPYTQIPSIKSRHGFRIVWLFTPPEAAINQTACSPVRK